MGLKQFGGVVDIESCIDVLRQLRELGTKIHIDDFGTGYSSLSYLHRIPFDALKIDRSFICDPSSNESTVPIVRTIMRLASDLGVQVVAEGVDTREQAEWLKSLDCQYAQGNLYSEPVEADDATKLLQAQAEPSAHPRSRPSAGDAAATAVSADDASRIAT